jgi:hypothetical protein
MGRRRILGIGAQTGRTPVQSAVGSAPSNQSWHNRWCLGTLVEDAGLSDRQMQQCHQRNQAVSTRR